MAVVKVGKALARQMAQLVAQIRRWDSKLAKKPKGGTTKEIAFVAALKKDLIELRKSTVKAKTAAAKAKKSTPLDLKQELAAEQTAKAKQKARKKEQWKAISPKDRKEVKALAKAQKKDIASEQKTISTAGGTRVRTFTKEGRDLYESANPADHERLLKSLLQEKYGGTKGVTLAKTSRLVRDALNAPLVPKGVLDISDAEFAKLSTLAKIDHLMGRTAPALTRSQAARAMRGKEMPPDPEAIKRGFQEFKKGGLSQKKYQKTVKYGGKEYVYMGGGLVGDIMHFKKKRGR